MIIRFGGKIIFFTNLVPIGEVKNNSKSPLRLAFAVITACTCSKYLTSVSVPWHASVFIRNNNDRDEGIGLKKKHCK
jgi:hypothetical protein